MSKNLWFRAGGKAAVFCLVFDEKELEIIINNIDDMNYEIIGAGSNILVRDNGFDGDFLVDAGLGIRLGKNIFGKSLYIRIDSPFWLNTPKEEESIDFSRIVFSFSKGI